MTSRNIIQLILLLCLALFLTACGGGETSYRDHATLESFQEKTSGDVFAAQPQASMQQTEEITGADILYAVLTAQNASISDLQKNVLAARLQKMIDAGTDSNLQIALVLAANPQIRGTVIGDNVALALANVVGEVKTGLLFTVTVDDRIANEVDPSDYYLVSTSDAAFGYPDSYLESATTQEDIAIYPCQLEVDHIAYPKSWLGNYPLPEVKNAPLAASISRGVNMKDIMLPDNPTFIHGCSGDLSLEFARSFDRLVDLGVDHVQVTQWHWAGIRDDGTWYVFDVGDSFGGLSNASLENFVSAAHSRGLKVLMHNQIQAVSDGPGLAYVPEPNLENYQKWLDAFAQFMRSRAAYFESIGIDLWEMGCSVCMYWDSGDGSPEANELFANAYSAIIDEVKTLYTGSTFLSTPSWLFDRPDILEKIDYLSEGIWFPEINSMPDSFDASMFRDYILDSGWASGMDVIDSLGKPIIMNFGIQSRSNALTYPGYVEETGCTASLEDIFDITPGMCVQREIQPDFSLQAVVIEGFFEAIQSANLDNLKMVTIGDYWETDSMYSKDLFPNIGTTFRNKPAEGVIQQWFARSE